MMPVAAPAASRAASSWPTWAGTRSRRSCATLRAAAPAWQALLAQAREDAADLLVMGGYGHSRLREMMLGGTTRSILEHMTVPVLFSH